MLAFFRRLWNDRRGNVLVMTAAAMPLIIGAAGLANDTIQWTLWKRQLQRAADSAAIAGVYDRVNNGDDTDSVDEAVTHDLSLNLHTAHTLTTGNPDCDGHCTIEFPDDEGSSVDAVKVTISVRQPLPFTSFFMRSAPTITASATAAELPAGGDACVEALDTSSGTGVTFTGNSAVEMPSCDIFSNTSGTNSAVGKGSADVIANSVGGVGGIQQSNNFHVHSYRPYSPQLPDPFSGVNPDPSDMHCAVTATTKKGVTTYTPQALTDASTITTMKDQYGNQANCFSSLSVASNTTLTIPSTYTGPIYINGGSIDFKGNFTCANCTIVLTNTSTASNATIGGISANAGANINITAPTSGTYEGIAIFQDRRAVTGGSNKVNGHSGSVIIGALYFPKQELVYNGTGTTQAYCTMFVAYHVSFSGNSSVSNKFKSLSDCAAEGLPQNTSSTGVAMVRLIG